MAGLLAAAALLPSTAAPASIGSSASTGSALLDAAVVSNSSPGTSSFDRDAKLALQTVQAYWKQNFRASGVAFHPIRKVIPYTAGTASRYSCAGHPMVPHNALYCPAGDFIAYDSTWVRAQYKSLGNAFVLLLVGHEYGHRAQTLLPLPQTTEITMELEADCLAGAYLGDSERAHILTLHGRDIDTLKAGFELIGDRPGTPWFTPGAHGTPQQRMSSFSDGFDRGLAGC
jgi:predicted metalloprotease